jgi:hypothetical protein
MARTTFSGPVIATNGFAGTTGVALSKTLAASAALDFASIAAAASADLTIAVTGAAVNDTVRLGLPAAPTAGIIFQAFVSAADVVTIRATNITAGAVDPASATYAVTVIQTVAVPAANP